MTIAAPDRNQPGKALRCHLPPEMDLERVVPCVPGARIIETIGDRAARAEVKIKLGAMTMNYSGPAEIVRRGRVRTPRRDERARKGGGGAGQRRRQE